MILVYQVCNIFITGGQYLVRFLGSASIFVSATSQYHVNLESETTLFLWRDFKMSGRSCGTPLISVLLLRSSRDVRNSLARDFEQYCGTWYSCYRSDNATRNATKYACYAKHYSDTIRQRGNAIAE